MSPGNQQPLLNTCPSCQEIIDVSGVRPYEKIHCPLCGDTIRVRTVFNHFTLKAEIGQGGMSRVFRAADNNLGREVALKILHSRYDEFPQLAAQFEREAKITACITHPNVVKIYSAGRDQGYYYIAMELLPGKSLEHLITERGRIPEVEALRIIHEIALGLSAAFQHGLIHRDVKPGNILLDQDGSAKLVDFGIALMQGTEEDPLAEVWATPFYVPPEKLWNRPEDFRSDIYSLGATLYHMIAGQPPHCAETDSIQELITIKSQPLDLRVGAAHMHDGTLQLISRMMAYDPPARYASYEDLLAAIESVRRKVDPRLSPSPRIPRWALITSAAAGVIVLGLLGLLLFQSRKPAPSIATTSSRSSAPLVVSAEEASIAQLLPRAREALAANDLPKAVSLLKELAAKENARADWRAWAAFQLGIETLFQNDLETSRASFAQAAGLGPHLDPALSAFFSEVAQVLQTDQPPSGSQGEVSPLSALRSLASGLKQWLANDFPGAKHQFSQYLLGPFTGDYEWVAVYRSRVDSLQADLALVESLPGYSSIPDLPKLTECLDQLASIHKQLKEERTRQTVATAIAGAEKRIAELMEAARAASSKQALSADFALIQETRKACLEKGAQRHFAEAAQAWRTAAWQTDAGKQSGALHAEACEQAARFLELLFAGLPQFVYEGEIVRTEGRSFTAKLLRAGPEGLVVDLGFGPTPLKMETISSQGLWKIAQATVLRNRTPDLEQAACFFAWCSGLEPDARNLALKLREIPGFQNRWEAVTQPTPTP